jgi:basic membrane lipoprotein Med (substrate-binding protein (PBP1-ABC) superfamily)
MISALVRSKAFVPAVSCTGALLSHSISNCSADVSPSSSKVKIGLCQMGAGADKEFNIAKAKGFMQEAKAKGAEVIVLPEVRNLVC